MNTDLIAAATVGALVALMVAGLTAYLIIERNLRTTRRENTKATEKAARLIH